MVISIPQALLIGLVYFAANTSFLAGLGYFTTWRPLVNGLLVGLILGDPMRGTTVGALINVLYLGYISVGGTLGIGDAALAGIIGAVAGIAVPVTDPLQAVGLGVLAGVLLGNLGFPLLTLRMNLDNRIVLKMDLAAARGDARAIMLWNILGGQRLLIALTLPAAGLLALLTPPVLSFLVTLSPSWVLHAVGVAGTGIAGALGIALAMRFVYKSSGILLFFVGFAVTAALHLNIALFLIPILVVIALYTAVTRLSQNKNTSSPAARKVFWLWQFFSHSSYSFERLQGSGVACALAPFLQQIYHGHTDLTHALKRHLAFYNVEPNWGSLVLGVMTRLEQQVASGMIQVDEVANTRKTLMGTVSGFGDSASQGAILPLCLSLGLAISLDPNMATLRWTGVCVYLLLICPVMLAISYQSFQLGLARGRESVIALLGSAWIKRWLVIAELLGALMLGVLAAMPAVTGLHLNLAPGLPGSLFSIILPLALVLALFYIMQKLQVKPILLLICCAAVCMLLALVGAI